MDRLKLIIKCFLEIFGSFGAVQSVEIPGGSGLSFTFRHCCFVEYEQTADAAKALKVSRCQIFEIRTEINLCRTLTCFKYMDGGQIDGQEVMVTMVKPTRGGGPRRHKFDHDSRR